VRSVGGIGMPTHCRVASKRPGCWEMQPPAVSVLVVDDHPALRAGLKQLLEQEAGYRLLGTVSNEAELTITLQRHQPDVVIMDYALTRGDGLSACFRLKQRPHPPGVVLYSAYVDDVFAVPATLAQADAIVSKNDSVEVLLTAINAVAAGESQVPSPDPEALEAASSRLRAEDLPILGMLFASLRVDDIATTLGVDPRDVRARALRIIGEMQAQDRRHGHVARDGSVTYNAT
jgi:DNA-binding NarL/FixJ family response regulator